VSRHRFVFLFVTLLMFFMVAPIVHQIREVLHPAGAPFVEALLFIAVLAGVVVSISTTRMSKTLALSFSIPMLVLIVLHAFGDWAWIAIMRHLVGAAFLGYAIVVMLGSIFTSRQITHNTVFASLCVYLLLGVLWALGYSVIDHLDPAAFQSSIR